MRLAANSRLQSIAAVLAITCCVATLLAFGELRGNEYDALPSAKQFVDRQWLANDWYLNRTVGYRLAFNWLAGLALRAWSFPVVALAGRLAIFFGFACACVALCRSFGLSLWYCIPWVYLYLPTQSLAAGEWILKSLETKPFAYVAALFSLAALARRRYRAMAAWLGVTLTFHLLIGVYAGVCTLACLLLREHRPCWRRPAHWLLSGLVTGSVGLATLYEYGAGRAGMDSHLALRGAEVYVQFRVPHHVLPAAWPERAWPLYLGLSIAGNAWLWTRPRYRLLAHYSLSAAGIFVGGLFLAYTAAPSIMRFYWFRFGDTMLPLLGWFQLLLLVNDGSLALARRPGRAWREAAALARGSMICLTFVLATLTFSLFLRREPATMFGDDIRRRVGLPAVRHTEMGEWIRQHTARRAVFLIDPSLDSFYVDAERAVFVSFKHSPQSEPDILEWYTRIVRLSAAGAAQGAHGTSGLAAAPALQVDYGLLSAADVAQLSKDYTLDYMLSENPELPFPVAHRVAGSTLYRLRD